MFDMPSDSPDGLDSVYARNIPIIIRETVLGQPCIVRCCVFQSVDLHTGDQTDSVSIDEIITEGTGQCLFPKLMTIDQFRSLVSRVRAKAEVTL